nr:hypothetical protein Iba_chr06bCG4950 [Ipomoea batatas]GMD10253.1 hypothetical protein Iba_chr06eCG4500 [Ipomoea batatas]
MDSNDNRLALLILTGCPFLKPSKAKFTSSTFSIISPYSWVSINVAAIDADSSCLTFLLIFFFCKPPFSFPFFPVFPFFGFPKAPPKSPLSLSLLGGKIITSSDSCDEFKL